MSLPKCYGCFQCLLGNTELWQHGLSTYQDDVASHSISPPSTVHSISRRHFHSHSPIDGTPWRLDKFGDSFSWRLDSQSWLRSADSNAHIVVDARISLLSLCTLTAYLHFWLRLGSHVVRRRAELSPMLYNRPRVRLHSISMLYRAKGTVSL